MARRWMCLTIVAGLWVVGAACGEDESPAEASSGSSSAGDGAEAGAGRGDEAEAGSEGGESDGGAAGEDEGGPESGSQEPADSQAADMGDDADPEDDAGPGTGDLEAPCADASIGQLVLLEAENPAPVESSSEADGLHARIDASAGGASPTEGYVYARFTDDGLLKVELGDEDALASTAWHIALRRYVIRLNSGVSGPGEVLGARTAPDTAFDELSEVPGDLAFHAEAYFTDSCDYVPDTSGIGAPATVLSSFWSYTSCVQMTGNVYVIQVSPERALKLQVLSYYTDDNQAICDETGEVPQPSGAAQFHLRWAWLTP